MFQSSDGAAAVLLRVGTRQDPPVRLCTSPWSDAFTALKRQADPNGRELQAKVIRDMHGGL